MVEIWELLRKSHQELAQIAFTMQREHPGPMIDLLEGFELGKLLGLDRHVGPEEVEILGLCIGGNLEFDLLGDVPEDLVFGLRDIENQAVAH